MLFANLGKIRNISYIGGPTFLAKALLFASGILYQEQNMKNGKRRKHKFMPTPRHDRLQVQFFEKSYLENT